MNHPDTAQVVVRVLSGEIDAYVEIIRRYQRDVWRVIAAMLLNTERTEDLVQQTFIKAYQHLHSYDPERDFGAWIKQIARNEGRQAIRAGGREQHWLECYHEYRLSSDQHASTSDREDQFAEALDNCTKQLPPRRCQTRRTALPLWLGFRANRRFPWTHDRGDAPTPRTHSTHAP